MIFVETLTLDRSSAAVSSLTSKLVKFIPVAFLDAFKDSLTCGFFDRLESMLFDWDHSIRFWGKFMVCFKPFDIGGVRRFGLL